MNNKLKEIQEKLKTRATALLDIMDCVTEKMFQRGINQAFLDKNHGGSLPAFLEDLHKKGLQKIQILPRIKNGNTSKPGGPSINVDFTAGTSNPENNTAPVSGPSAPMMPQTGLNGAFGLGMPEIMDGFAAKRELEIWKMNCAKFEKLYEREREKRKELGDKVSELLRENDHFSWEKNVEKEPSKFDKIIDGIFANPEKTIPALMGVISQFKGGGLNAPAAQEAQIVDPLEGYTDLQRALCETIGQCPPDFCEDLATLISRVFEQDKPFMKELKRLLETKSLEAV